MHFDKKEKSFDPVFLLNSTTLLEVGIAWIGGFV
jgi:hypothetical protein